MESVFPGIALLYAIDVKLSKQVQCAASLLSLHRCFSLFGVSVDYRQRRCDLKQLDCCGLLKAIKLVVRLKDGIGVVLPCFPPVIQRCPERKARAFFV